MGLVLFFYWLHVIGSSRFLFWFLIFLLCLTFYAYVGINVLGVDSGPPGGSGQVKIEKSEVVGNYAVNVLKASAPHDLNQWLTENGFQKFPEDAVPTLASYIQDGWCFVAAKLQTNASGFATPHPISLTFKTTKPVYPMRLTALPGNPVYLEFYVIAEQEALLVDYDVDKQGVGIFTEGKYEWNSSLFYSLDHSKAEDYFWNQCVVTRFVDTIKARHMKKDMYLEFQDPKPFRKLYYSHGAAIVRGMWYAVGPWSLALLVFRIVFRKQRFRPKGERWSDTERKWFWVSICMSCLIIGSVYLFSPKLDVRVGRPGERWSNYDTFFRAIYNSRYAVSEMEGREIDNFINEVISRTKPINPLTGKMMAIEESPGNIQWIAVKDIRYIRLYGHDGGTDFIFPMGWDAEYLPTRHVFYVLDLKHHPY